MSNIISNTQLGLISKAQEMATGMQVHFGIFENPTVPHKVLEQDAADCIKVRDEEIAGIAALKAIRLKKVDYFKKLKEDYGKDKIYCQMVAKGNISTLEMVGLSGPKEKKKPQIPSQCGSFRVIKQRLESADTEWDRPSRDKGGKQKSFRIYRSADGKTWILDAAPILNKYVIKSQGDGTTFFYYVTAVNAVGESDASNIITLKF